MTNQKMVGLWAPDFALDQALLLKIILSTDRSMQLAALQTARTLCVVVKTLAIPAGGEGRLGTGGPTVSVTSLYGRWRTSWKMLPETDPGTGCTGQETYQRTMFGPRPGNSSCQNLQSSPGSSTSNVSIGLTVFLTQEMHDFSFHT